MLNVSETENLEMIKNFVKGKIKLEEYIKKRGITPRVKLNEAKYLINYDPLIYNDYLAKLTIGIRCLVMKSVLNLTDRQLIALTSYNSKTSISKFISSNFTSDTNDIINKKPNFSIKLLFELAIILDIPFNYLVNTKNVYSVTNSSEEYNNVEIQEVSLKEIIEIGISKSKKSIGEQREIFGVRIKNPGLFKLEKLLLNTRVDVRSRYFTIEINIEEDGSLNYQDLLKVQSIIKIRNEVFIRDAILRKSKKLILLIMVDNLVVPDISYLNDKYRLENLFSLDNIMSKGNKNE